MDYIIEIFNILSDLLFTQDNTHYQAVVPPAVVIMGLQAAFSAGQAIKGGIDKRKAEEDQKKAIASYENKLRNIEIQNELEALRVPTMGAELRERGIARATTAGIESMQEAGAEAVLGGVPRVVTAADAQSAQVAAELDQMQARRDELVLKEDQRIEDERARREEQIAGVDMMRAQGAGAAAADAARQQQSGFYGIASGLGGMAVQSAAAQNPYQGQFTDDQMSSITTSEVSNVGSIDPAQQSPIDSRFLPRSSGAAVTTPMSNATNLTGLPTQTLQAIEAAQMSQLSAPKNYGYGQKPLQTLPGGVAGGLSFIPGLGLSPVPLIPSTDLLR